MAAATWLSALGAGLSGFAKGREQNRQSALNEAEQKFQQDLQKQQLARALARDQIEDLRHEQQQKRQSADDYLKTATPGSAVAPEGEAVLKAGGFGHMVGQNNPMASNIPSQFTLPDLAPTQGFNTLLPTQAQVGQRDDRMQQNLERTQDVAHRDRVFAAQAPADTLAHQRRLQELGAQQGGAVERIKLESSLAAERGGLTPAVLAQLFPKFVDATMTMDANDNAVPNLPAALAELEKFKKQFGPPPPVAPGGGAPTPGQGGPTFDPRQFFPGYQQPSMGAPRAAPGSMPPRSLSPGTRGTINGQPAIWDGQGWVAQ